MTEITIQLPTPYDKLACVLQDQSSALVIEAAPCTKVVPALLGWLFQRALRGEGAFLWSSVNYAEMRARCERWLAAVPDAYWKVKGNALLLPRSRITFTRELPDETFNDAVIADCDLIPDVRAWVALHVTGTVRTVGSVASTDHWFFGVARQAEKEGNYKRLTANDAIDAGVITQEQLDRVAAVTPPSAFKRQYACVTEVASAAPIILTRFFRERLWIRTKTGDVVPFNVNPIQHRYIAKKRAEAARLRRAGLPSKFLLLKYRRGGFTTLEQGTSYAFASTRPNVQCVTLAHTKDSTTRIFRMVKLFQERNPDPPKHRENANELEFTGLNSLHFIGTAGGKGFGRGDTLQRVHGSEVSKWCEGPEQLEKVDDLVAGLAEAASHGEVVLETTPNGVEWFCHKYREAKKKQNDWVPIFLPWFEDRTNRATVYDQAEILDTLTDRERFLMEQRGLDCGQIAWRRAKVKDLKKLFPQEYPEDDETCFLLSGRPFFDNEKILNMLEMTPEYERKHVPGGYIVIWEKPQKGVEYVLGADTSEGIPGGDSSGYGVLRRDTGDQVASLHGIFKPHVLAGHIAVAHKLYNDCIVGVERENHGHSVLNSLRTLGLYRDINIGGRLFYFAPEREGWSTNGETRPIMLDELAVAVEQGEMKVRDRDFLSECLTFRMQDNGKFEADPGCHDDTVMKWAIAWQMRKYRKKYLGATVG